MSAIQAIQQFCLADSTFFDAPDRLPDHATRYAWAARPMAPGWRRSARGLWIELFPEGTALPEQGWKIHVSAIPAQAAATLDTVARLCLSWRVAFKFLRSDSALRLAVGKYAARGSSGKFITIYPVDDQQFSGLLHDLVAALDGRPGPYILSDLRIGRGPVYVRYGSFVQRWCAGPDGTPVLALRHPSGRLVPDDRRPVFHVPSWVAVPPVLAPHVAARAATAEHELPYPIVRALYFTNGGGTYLAEDPRSGRRVVLREARPHSGLDDLGADAMTRLRREHDTLTRLARLDFVPRVYGTAKVWEHEFLIEEYLEGLTLLEAVIYRYPLTSVHPCAESVATYLQWVDKIINGLAGALDALHACGVAFGDLHPGNIIVRPDDSVALVDFEYASAASAVGRVRFGAAGFATPPGVTAAQADRFALRVTWLMMLVPLVELAEHDPQKLTTLATYARRRFNLGPDAGPRLPDIGRGLAPKRPSGESVVRELFEDPIGNWPDIRDQLVTGVLRAATPERTDRLFPADPQVFNDQGACLAHGAAGVLLALHRVGLPVPDEHTDWLVAAAKRTQVQPGRGLFDGLYGVAAVLAELGRRDDALEVLFRCRDADPTPAPGLFAGHAGVALTKCSFGQVTGDESLIDEAIQTARRLDTLIGAGGAAAGTVARSAGLLHGMTGAALLAVHLFRVTGDDGFLRACRRALAHELGHCVLMPDGTRQVKIGHRHLTYLDGGSAGIALVAGEYLTHQEDPELDSFVRAVRRACGNEFMREPGLFRGRAGLLAVLSQLGGPDTTADVLAQARRIGWYAVHRDGALLIPGRLLRRCGADLAYGSAGVLLALQCVVDGSGLLRALLPQLEQPVAALATASV